MATETLTALFTLSNNIRHTVSDKRDLLCTSIDRLGGYCLVDHNKDPEYQLLKTLLSKVMILSSTINAGYQTLTNSCSYIWEDQCIKYDAVSFEDIPVVFNEMIVRVEDILQTDLDKRMTSVFNVIKSRLADAAKFYVRYQKKFAVSK